MNYLQLGQSLWRLGLLRFVVVATVVLLIVGTDNVNSSWAGNRLMVYLLHSLPRDASWGTPQPALSYLELTPIQRASSRAKGIWWFWAGEYNLAQSSLQSLSTWAQGDVIVALYLGTSYLATGEGELAGEVWREASTPGIFGYLLRRSKKAWETGDQAKAVTFLEMAESIDPTDGRIYLEHARIARHTGAHIGEVIRWLELAIASAPYPAEAFTLLAEHYTVRGDYRASVEVLQRGRELYPDGFLYALGRGLIRVAEL